MTIDHDRRRDLVGWARVIIWLTVIILGFSYVFAIANVLLNAFH